MKKELIENGLLPENVDDYVLYDNGFKYKVNGKWTLKNLQGVVLCENVDYCCLYPYGFEYRVKDKWTLKNLQGSFFIESL